MATRDIEAKLGAVTSIAPADNSASVNGTGVDLRGFSGAMVVFNVGAINDGTHTPSLEESDDDAVYTAVAAADQLGTLAALTANTNQKVGYRGTKRYIRAVSTVAGATSGNLYGALVIRGKASFEPVS